MGDWIRIGAKNRERKILDPFASCRFVGSPAFSVSEQIAAVGPLDDNLTKKF